MRVRDLLVDSPGSVGARLRERRWQTFRTAFPHVAGYTVLDLGGTADYWRRAPVRPMNVTVVNLHEPGEPSEGIEPLLADACTFTPTRGYDLVVSNSLLEHVGGRASRRRLAEVIATSAPRHWVQTPYRYFPIEPHWLFPGMQFLPVSARVGVARYWPLQHTRSPDRRDAVESVLGIELIGRTEMADLFPSSTLRFEWVAGLPKSLIAVSN